MAKQEVLQFHDFCEKVLHIKLTAGQLVIAKVAFGNYDPIDLPDDERSLAIEMFGGLERVSPEARKYIVMMLGRGSGKTTMCSAYCVYTAVTFDVSKCGPGDVPYVIVIAPDKETAKLSIRMSREMLRSNSALERLVVNDESQAIQLRRPDGRFVKIEAFAASRGGSAVRGRSIMAFLMDECAFFTSSDGLDGRDYSVNDKDIFRALKPRLMPSGRGMLISTPWPVPSLFAEMFESNWGKCHTAVAIKAPTMLVRGDDPDIVAMVEDELAKDPENARRELFCELDGLSGGEFFDTNAISSSLELVDEFPVAHNPRWPVAVGCDLGFKSDSSAIAVVQFDGKHYRLVHAEELRPQIGKPLQPTTITRRFAEITKRYGASGAVADSYYREAFKEALSASGLVVYDAPEGVRGKADVFQRTRSVMHEGQCKIPDVPIGRRLAQQAKLVVSKPAPGGTISIRIPRKIGMGHGDLVSAWTLAVHRLAYSRLKNEIITYEPGTSGWVTESARRLVEYQERQQANYLKEIQKQARKNYSASQYRRVFEGRH